VDVPGEGARRWRVWIDTGGTFTDCLAVDPEGRFHRAKVLSSSALRGEVVEALAADQLRVRPGWEVAVGFFEGFRFHLLSGGRAPAAEPEGGGSAKGGLTGGGRPGEEPVTSGAAGGKPVDEEPSVESWEPEESVLRLASPLAVPPAPGSRFELRSREEAPVLAARLVTRTAPPDSLPPMDLRLATTRGTNALLERRGAAVGLVVTCGFADLLEIGTQQRPDLFALAVDKPAPLYRAVVEVDERLDAEGRVLAALDPAAVDEAAERLREAGVESVAVAFLHGYREPAHERAAVERLARHGFRHVVGSAALAPLIKIVPRAETAVVEAYLAPILEDYLGRVEAALGEGTSTLHVMTSAGGLVGRSEFRAKDGLLSGPAGGVAGAAQAARRSGFGPVLSFDMGGTSTDVARWDGDFAYRFEHRVGDARLIAPALAIETVAAGGGSVCGFDGAALTVGPESAGARPGPACYGDGGPLTLTDVDLLLGRLDPARFGIPVDPEAAERAFAAIAEEVAAADRGAVGGEAGGGSGDVEGEERAVEGSGGEDGEAASVGRERLLAGFLAIADERMADAIRAVSVRQGYDPADHALVAFGGAGGQHACAVAALLGVRTVVVPPDAGLLSAAGLGTARIERFAQRQVLRPLDEVEQDLPDLLAELASEAAGAVAAEGIAEEDVEVRRRLVHLRFAGQETTLEVEWEGEAGGDGAPHGAGRLRDAFGRAYRDRYGYLPEDRPVEVESVRAVASSRVEEEPATGPPAGARPAEPIARRRAWLGEGWVKAPVFERSGLAPGVRFSGPALVYERHGATVLPPGWSGEVDGAGALVLRRAVGSVRESR